MCEAVVSVDRHLVRLLKVNPDLPIGALVADLGGDEAAGKLARRPRVSGGVVLGDAAPRLLWKAPE